MIEIYAAVDIMGGRCVRLRQGDMSQQTDYGDPVELARLWEAQGCDWLHVVDLDGAAAGRPVNRSVVEKIVEACSVPVQLGGGLRNQQAWEWAFGIGCARLVLGSIAFEDPDLAAEATASFEGRFALGLDVREGTVAVRGWRESAGITVDAAFERLGQASFDAVVVTDISRDGLQLGPNFDLVERCLDKSPWPVIASGGIAGAEDIEALSALAMGHPNGSRLVGVVVGRALYEGSLSILEAKEAAGG